MSARKKVMYVMDKVVEQKRHSRNCSVKKGPGQYEEPDVLSSSDEEQPVVKEDDSIRIINAVHKRPCLWDNRISKSERTPALAVTLWAEVDAELGLEPGKAKSAWCTLRHRYCSETRKIESGTPTCWVYYNQLTFLAATRQNNRQSIVAPAPQTSTRNIVKPKVPPAKRKKGAKNHQVIEESTQLVSLPIQQNAFRNSREPLFMSRPNQMEDRMKRELSLQSSDSEVDVVEEINMSNGSLMQSHIDNPISYKRVCIRRMQETQVENIEDDDEDDEIKRFCSYLEVMLRKMPKSSQEMFCEETLDHLASVNRKLRRFNY